ncbi:hypothetical protein M8494_07585 [Serratia ureilytica]
MMGASTRCGRRFKSNAAPRWGSVRGCSRRISPRVKRDFLQNRITRWEADCWAPQRPIAWVSPDAITARSGVAGAAVRGTKADKPPT